MKEKKKLKSDLIGLVSRGKCTLPAENLWIITAENLWIISTKRYIEN